MSKVDAQRAMREANYARRLAQAEGRATPPAASAEPPAAPAPPTQTPTPTATPTSARAPRGATTAATSASEVCGHRSMNGRACTRPMGHSEKSHRYQ